MKRKYKIKIGAQVDQDMSFFYWDEKYYPGKLDTAFEIDGKRDIFPSKRICLIAHGFGIIGGNDGKSYGNGAIYVKKEDLIPVETETE